MSAHQTGDCAGPTSNQLLWKREIPPTLPEIEIWCLETLRVHGRKMLQFHTIFRNKRILLHKHIKKKKRIWNFKFVKENLTSFVVSIILRQQNRSSLLHSKMNTLALIPIAGFSVSHYTPAWCGCRFQYKYLSSPFALSTASSRLIATGWKLVSFRCELSDEYSL